MKRILYKYRSLNNLKRLIEIIVDNKLYASKYNKLNDPMEGYYTYNKNTSKYRREINQIKKDALICSLSQSPNVGLLWIMYADEGRGCCLEVEVNDDNSWTMVDVEYKNTIPCIDSKSDISLENIFKYKSSIWDYEKETRYIKESSKMYKLPVKVKKIYLGYSYKASDKNYKFYKTLFEDRLGIPVELMDRNQIDFGYSE